jgi:hypothetical protein
MRLKCGGYFPAKKQKPQRVVQQLLPLVPKVSGESKPALLPMPGPRSHRFANEQEYYYFMVFCNTTASNLAEYLDSSLWNTIVLQATEQEPFIRHAVIALGALNKSVEVQIERSAFSLGRVHGDTAHYEAAYREYGKSIRGIRKACEEQRRSKRTILIACLLAICFEYFHGNVASAMAHIRSGIKLINEWFWSIIHLASIDQNHLLPGIIEDELVCVFSRLEVDVFTWYEAEQVPMNPDLAKLAIEIIQAIPSQGFANINSARKYFDIMLREVDWFVRSVNDQLWNFSDESVTTLVKSSVAATLPSPEQEEQADYFKRALLSWITAFQPLLAGPVYGPNDSLVTKALFLRHICSSIAINCCFGPELSYDSYIPQFQEALQLAEALAAATFSKDRPTFTVWSILVKSLYFIALKCRNHSLRREAIFSLQSISRREGLWDAPVASRVATIIMELEESKGYHDESREHFVSENQRLRASKVSFEMHDRRGKIRYLTTKGDSEGCVRFVAGQIDFSW